MKIALTFFEALLMGHLIGDYIFQTNWMAQRKGSEYFPCFVHCLIYTFFVCALTSWNPLWILLVFLSHFLVDKFSLADKWLMLIGSRSITKFLFEGHRVNEIEDENCKENYIILRGGFTALVYAVADNTLHLMLMLLAAKFVWW